jgi:RNA polymerase sigma-70 factor (ECF subfamily)
LTGANDDPFLATRVLGSPGHWRMMPTTANGQPAAVGYIRKDGAYHPFGLVVLTMTTTGISRITAFDDAAMAVRFGLPAVLEQVRC